MESNRWQSPANPSKKAPPTEAPEEHEPNWHTQKWLNDFLTEETWRF